MVFFHPFNSCYRMQITFIQGKHFKVTHVNPAHSFLPIEIDITVRPRIKDILDLSM